MISYKKKTKTNILSNNVLLSDDKKEKKCSKIRVAIDRMSTRMTFIVNDVRFLDSFIFLLLNETPSCFVRACVSRHVFLCTRVDDDMCQKSQDQRHESQPMSTLIEEN